jgi:3-phenylpropionate/cinnamic acid dioxygenase small subunit
MRGATPLPTFDNFFGGFRYNFFVFFFRYNFFVFFFRYNFLSSSFATTSYLLIDGIRCGLRVRRREVDVHPIAYSIEVLGRGC